MKRNNSGFDNIVKKSSSKNKLKSFVKFCPRCKSTKTDIDASLCEAWDRCTHCGFRARSFPEKERK